MWRGLNVCHLRMRIPIRSIDWGSILDPTISGSGRRWSRLFIVSDKNVWVIRHVDRYTAGDARWREMTIVLGNGRGIKCREGWN